MTSLDFSAVNSLSPRQLDELIRKAKDGDYLSNHYLGLYYLSMQDPKAALPYLKLAASHNNSMSLSVLGDIYYEGSYGVHKDDRKALDYYNEAATLNDIDAIRTLAIIHYQHYLDTGAQLELSLYHSYTQKAKDLGYTDIYNYLNSIIS